MTNALTIPVAAAFVLAAVSTAAGAFHAPVSSATQDPQRTDLAKEVASLRQALERFVRDGERRGEELARRSMFDPPIGAVMAYGGDWPPPKAGGGQWTEDEVGWILCDGRDLKEPKYAGLRAVLGRDALPDWAGRTVVVSGNGAGLTARTPAEVGGAEEHALTVAQMPKHSHGVTDPGHVTPGVPGDAGQIYDSGGNRQAASFFNGPRNTRAFTGISIIPEGGGQSFSVMQPFVALRHIVKFR